MMLPSQFFKDSGSHAHVGLCLHLHPCVYAFMYLSIPQRQTIYVVVHKWYVWHVAEELSCVCAQKGVESLPLLLILLSFFFIFVIFLLLVFVIYPQLYLYDARLQGIMKAVLQCCQVGFSGDWCGSYCIVTNFELINSCISLVRCRSPTVFWETNKIVHSLTCLSNDVYYFNGVTPTSREHVKNHKKCIYNRLKKCTMSWSGEIIRKSLVSLQRIEGSSHLN